MSAPAQPNVGTPPPQLRPYSDPLQPKQNPLQNVGITPQGTVIDMSNIQDNLEEIYKQQQDMLKCVAAGAVRVLAGNGVGLTTNCPVG